jgi:hypothetical protein
MNNRLFPAIALAGGHRIDLLAAGLAAFGPSSGDLLIRQNENVP